MLDAEEIKLKILEILKQRGPSLPIHVANSLEISSIFASAFLSELLNEKKIVISNLKVGGSPLYFLREQKEMLEKFYGYLHPKESEAFLLLKEKKILEDEKQLPAIRVALRNIKDFAIAFKKNEKIFWRYFSVKEDEIKEIKKEKKVEKPVLELKPVKKKVSRVKEKSDFVLGVMGFIRRKNIMIVDERDFKKREYVAVVRINSELGRINFLCLAKDKKRVTDNDLRLLVQRAQAEKLPGLMIFPHEINKKAQEYALEYSSLLKVLRMN